MVSASRIDPPIKRVAILTGTTASGKTAAAIAFARSHPEIEIVNADSLLIYRGFDIGTAKPTAAERSEIRHHLIDVRDPSEIYTAGDFVRDCNSILQDIHGRGKRAMIVGGTGFYLKALLYGLWDAPRAPAELRRKLEARSNQELYDELYLRDEEAALRISRNDRYRLIRAAETIATTGKTPSELETESASRPSVAGLSLFITDRHLDELKERIAHRTDEMLRAGFIAEVATLLERFPGARPFESVGYAEAVNYLAGRAPEGRKVPQGVEGLASEIRLATTQLAKRQRTWFHGQFARVSDLKFFTLPEEGEKLQTSLEDIY